MALRKSIFAIAPAALALGMVFVPGQARALEDDDDDMAYRTPAREERHLVTDIGVGASVGGGVSGFISPDVSRLTDIGGNWTARLTLGTREFVALEAAYIGSAQNISASGLDPDASLVSNGLEGALRVNLSRSDLQPYVFGGAAWKHYSLVNERFNDSVVQSSDDVLEIPVGLGLAYSIDAVLLDARADYRPAFDDELIGGLYTMDNWGVSARVGFEF